jgi:hypothetical protein
VGFAHGEKPTFSEIGIWPQHVIFTSSARTWPLLMFSQDSSQVAAYEAVEGAERVMVCMLEVCKPDYDGRISICYGIVAYTDKDSHHSNKSPSWAHYETASR